MHILAHSVKTSCYSIATRSYSTLYPRSSHTLRDQQTNISQLWEEFSKHQSITLFNNDSQPLTYHQKVRLHQPARFDTIARTLPRNVYYQLPLSFLKNVHGWPVSNETRLPGYNLQESTSHKRVGVLERDDKIYELTHIFHESGLYTTLTIDERPLNSSKTDQKKINPPLLRERVTFHAKGITKGLPQKEQLFLSHNGQLQLFMRRTSLYNFLGHPISQVVYFAPHIKTKFSWVYDDVNSPVQIKTPNGTHAFAYDDVNCVKKTFVETGLKCLLAYDDYYVTQIKEIDRHQEEKIWNYLRDSRGKWVKEIDPYNQATLHYFDRLGMEIKKNKQLPRHFQESAFPPFLSTKYVTDTLGRPVVKIEDKKEGGQATVHYTYEGLFLTSETHDTGVKWLYSYDNRGNLVYQHRHDQMAQSGPELEIQYFYDDLNRMTAKIDYRDTKCIHLTEFAYDGPAKHVLEVPSSKISLKPGQKLKHKKLRYDAWGNINSVTVKSL